jgi:hypothetical protein
MAANCRGFVVAAIAMLVMLAIPADSIADGPQRSPDPFPALTLGSSAIAHNSLGDEPTIDASDVDASDHLNQERLVGTLDAGLAPLAVPRRSRRLLPMPRPRNGGVPAYPSLAPRAPPVPASLNT